MKPRAKPSSDGKKTGDRYSFSFYPAELKAMSTAITELGRRGISVDRTKLVRCLLHTTPEQDMLAVAVKQRAEDVIKSGPRETENVAERFTIERLGDDVRKVERVVSKMNAKGIKMNDSYVLRSLLRQMPPIEALTPVVKKYLEEFPEGRTRAARAKRNA